MNRPIRYLNFAARMILLVVCIGVESKLLVASCFGLFIGLSFWEVATLARQKQLAIGFFIFGVFTLAASAWLASPLPFSDVLAIRIESKALSLLAMFGVGVLLGAVVISIIAALPYNNALKDDAANRRAL